MGVLRLILAVSVILNHSPIALAPWRPLVPGDLAVQAFFVISGFYMSLVLSTKYLGVDGKIDRIRFWFARGLKIYPTYWLIVVCLLLFDSATRHALVSQFHHFGVWISMWAVLSNLSIFGLDGLLFVGVAPDGPWLLHSLAEAASPPLHWLIVVSPAWSLIPTAADTDSRGLFGGAER